jgi:hypothetical protein
MFHPKSGSLAVGLVLAVAAIMVVSGGCATRKQTGALGGAGLGAMAGGLIDGTDGALIGAAIGTGVGYIIGDQADEKKASELSKANDAGDHTEVGPLGGTRWYVASIEPKDVTPPFTSKIVKFGPRGHVTTSTTLPDGEVLVVEENYRVVDDMLVVNKPGYIINAKYAVDGDQLIMNAPEFRAVLKRF